MISIYDEEMGSTETVEFADDDTQERRDGGICEIHFVIVMDGCAESTTNTTCSMGVRGGWTSDQREYAPKLQVVECALETKTA